MRLSGRTKLSKETSLNLIVVDQRSEIISSLILKLRSWSNTCIRKSVSFFSPILVNVNVFVTRIIPTKLWRKKNHQVNDVAACDRITFEGDTDLEDDIEKELMSHGVGGLAKSFDFIMDKVFDTSLRSAGQFTRLKINNVKGMLLYGPPGTGKTLLAKALAKMLHAKVVMGPMLMSSYVDESKHSLRKLFDDATNDYKKYGDQSPLHMIIFDEIDSFTQGSGIVHQLFGMIDDVNACNNIFIIGTTSRMDLVDESLLRPGRLDLRIEIGIPNEKGRVNILKIHTQRMNHCGLLHSDVNLEQIGKSFCLGFLLLTAKVHFALDFCYLQRLDEFFKIHTQRMNHCGLLHSDVNLEQIASMTVGWTGAELASAVNSALSHAIVRADPNMLGQVNKKQIRVKQADFLHGVRDAIMEVEPRSSRRMINIFITGLSPWVLTTSNICSFKASSTAGSRFTSLLEFDFEKDVNPTDSVAQNVSMHIRSHLLPDHNPLLHQALFINPKALKKAPFNQSFTKPVAGLVLYQPASSSNSKVNKLSIAQPDNSMSSGTVVVDKKGMSTMETQDMSNAIQILDPDAVMCIVGSGANCSNPYVVFSIDDVHHLDKKHPS
ncbi:vesicle-fusing ATPase 2 [Jatropha curcas]|uniref:vesicle-fusing ATPase 2 n=1 Tax=Jatropha curcas TaxID=180498 RepID=UPI001893B89B|nr:vesicle-fusing ATPase 2 [Jatropha curcas]